MPAAKPADSPKPTAPHSPEPRKSHLLLHPVWDAATPDDDQSRWLDESERIQWEKTELALAKDDDGPFKKWGKGLKDKMHAAKDK